MISVMLYFFVENDFSKVKKIRIVFFLQVKLGERFLQKNAYETMLRENIDSNIIFTLIK